MPGGFIDPITLREVEPGRFAREDGDERAVLRTGADGRVETLFLAGFGLPFAFDRLARTESPPFQLGALATFRFAGFALLAASRGWWSRRFRIHFAAVAAGAALLLLVLHDWNLVGFHY